MPPHARLDPAPAPRVGLHTTEVETLDAVAPAWDALVRGSPLPSPFLTSWWLRAVRPRGEARFVLCHEGDRLVGGVALDRSHAGPASVVRMLGDGPLRPDHLDLVAEPARLDDVVAALAGWLAEGPPGAIDLRGLSDGASLLRALPTRPLVTQASAAPYLVLPAGGPVAPLSRRHDLHKQGNRFRRMGAEHRVVTGSDPGIGAALTDLRRLHVEHWGDGSGLARSFEQLAAAVLGAGAEARVHELVVDGEAVAAQVLLDVADRRCFYQAGRSMDRRWAGAGTVLLDLSIQAAQRDGMAELDFLRGPEAYKYQWTTDERPVLRARSATGALARPMLAVQRAAEVGRPAGRRAQALARRVTSSRRRPPAGRARAGS